MLSVGGQDTIDFTLLADDATGGNGTDSITDFFVGTYVASDNADRLDISELLVGYTPDADGAAHYVNGVAVIDAGETIANYLTLTAIDANTMSLSIDRDGTGGAYSSTVLTTFTIDNSNITSADVDLATLLANQQIVL